MYTNLFGEWMNWGPFSSTPPPSWIGWAMISSTIHRCGTRPTGRFQTWIWHLSWRRTWMDWAPADQTVRRRINSVAAPDWELPSSPPPTPWWWQFHFSAICSSATSCSGTGDSSAASPTHSWWMWPCLTFSWLASISRSASPESCWITGHLANSSAPWCRSFKSWASTFRRWLWPLSPSTAIGSFWRPWSVDWGPRTASSSWRFSGSWPRWQPCPTLSTARSSPFSPIG